MRWGIKGSVEASEGLTAVYRFESKISTTDGSQPGGCLACVGLSGGFGSISLGQIWNAAYNHAGAITDKSYYFGDSGTGYRHGNVLSYAFSSGAVGFQMGLILDDRMGTGKAIDKTEFGITIGLREGGKVAIAHTNKWDTMNTGIVTPAVAAVQAVPPTYRVNTGTTAEPMYVDVKPIIVCLTGTQNIAANVEDGVLAAGLALMERTNNRYHAVRALSDECKTQLDDDAATDDCATVTDYV